METRTTPPPKLDKDAQEKLAAKVKDLAPSIGRNYLRALEFDF